MTRPAVRAPGGNSCAQGWVILPLCQVLSTLAGCSARPPEPLSLQLARQQFPVATGSETARGQSLSASHCRSCHPDGSFQSWHFRYHSTPGGDPPTRGDVLRVLEIGLPGTTMTGHGHLPEPDRSALAAWVRHEARLGRLERLLALRARAGETLTPKLAASEAEIVRREFDNDARAITVPPEPADRSASAQAGAGLYRGEPSLCLSCHGQQGRGDGPRAAELVDDRGTPARPRDFGSGVFRGGGEARDLFLRIKCGVGGTPMPSFQGSLTDTQVWNLVHFIQSLAPR
jgi:mono/diheme cytochrome c family protein